MKVQCARCGRTLNETFNVTMTIKPLSCNPKMRIYFGTFAFCKHCAIMFYDFIIDFWAKSAHGRPIITTTKTDSE